jgi:outer membrane lipoprotein-sorting protein
MIRMGFVRLFLFFALLGGFSLSGVPGGVQAATSGADKADIERAEAYINSISTLQARFLQIAPNGAQSEGVAYLSRPGKLRLDYDPPVPIQIYGSEDLLIYYDSKLKQVSYLPIGSTPAAFLVRPNVVFDGKDVSVTRVQRQPGIVAISLVQAQDKKAGELTLVFSDNPFMLRQWRVTDAQGQVTTVSLFSARAGVTFDRDLFDFRDPNFFNKNNDTR